MLSASELASMRAVIEASFTRTATIRRPGASIPDGLGGHTTTPMAVATVPAGIHLGGRTPQEREIAAQVKAIALWVIAVPFGTDVRIKDTIEINGRSYEVTAPLGPDEYDLELRVAAVEVRTQ